MRILQVNTADRGGGAESSARFLGEAFRARGHAAWLAVGSKRSRDPNVFEIPVRPLPTLAGRLLQRLERLVRGGGAPGLPARQRLARWLGILADPQRLRDWRAGLEDFHFPGSRELLALPPAPPDLVHCHNLHGWYFDLRQLPELSRRVPVILNLRDAWLLTGHCAYFMDCGRWRHGCGECPDLSLYPWLWRDGTARNWQRKAEIYAASRLYVTAPSHWLLDCAEAAMLHGARTRVIPNGIDLQVFRPGDQAQARAALGLPADARILLFAASGARTNVFKDYPTMEAAACRIADGAKTAKTVFVCLGAPRGRRQFGSLQVRYVPFEPDRQRVARYYQAADVYLHAVRAEAFGKTVTEAMACGTPVVASRVGGIPEQVVDGCTGFLVPVGDPAAMAARTEQLLLKPELRARCSEAAAARAQAFGLDRQVHGFLAWYEEIMTDFACPPDSQPRN